jgi:hypothetical protein
LISRRQQPGRRSRVAIDVSKLMCGFVMVLYYCVIMEEACFAERKLEGCNGVWKWRDVLTICDRRT